MQRYLFALDLDGTVLDDASRLSEANRKVLFQLRDEGHVLCFVTGRTMIDMLQQRELFQQVDYVLMNSGGKLIQTATNEDVFDTIISRDIARPLVEFCMQENIRLYVMMGEQFACTEDGPEVSSYAEDVGVYPQILNTFDDLIDLPIEGCVAIGDRKKVEAFITQEKLPLNCLGSEPRITDIVLSTVDKWSGLCRLREALDTKLPVIAVGNYLNDIHMIEGADIGIAVNNAPTELKRAADLVLESDNNQNILEEIHQHIKDISN